MSRNTNTKRSGFTLVELLITLTILALLAAVIIPVVVQQVSAANGPKAVADLTSIRSGLENFAANLRGTNPGDLEDLVQQIGTSGDLDIDSNPYGTAEASRWEGPYIDLSIASTTEATNDVFTTGFDALINADLEACDIDAANFCATASGDFVVVKLNSLTAAAFGDINDLIDGTGENNSSTAGKFRYNSASSIGYYFAIPKTNK